MPRKLQARWIVIGLLVALFMMIAALPALAQGNTYVVRGGDTLASIAARYNVSLNSLMVANGITNANVVFAGQVLTIPSGTGNFGTGGPLSVNPPATPAVTAIPTREYVVQPGDTLTAIANRYNATVEEIAVLNDMTFTNHIVRGQVLIIPDRFPQLNPVNAVEQGGGPGETFGTGGPITAPAPVVSQPTPLTHTVELGDYVEYLALIYGTSVQAIATANNLDNPGEIFPGDVLVIPRPAPVG